MKTVVIALLFVTACGTDMGGIGGFGESEPDALVAAARGRHVVDGGVDLERGRETVDAEATSVDAFVREPDVAPAVPEIPPDVVPRRIGIACETDDQCGKHAGKCWKGVCTACEGPQCGACVEGATVGLACPVKAKWASACSYCEDDPRLWCDADHPCAEGRCLWPDCG